MAEPVWNFGIKRPFSWSPGKAMGPVCVIGRKLLRVMQTHGLTGLTANYLGFTHGVAPPIAITTRITFHDRRLNTIPADWLALSASEVDAVYPDSGLPQIPDEIECCIVCDDGTAQDPCPTISAWAAAFASSPPDATW